MNALKLKNIFFYHFPTLLKIHLRRMIPVIFNKLSITPILSSVMITGRCNSCCVTCGIWRSQPEGELTTNEWKNVFLQLRNEGVLYLNITGGEPLLRDDLVELVDYANSLGFYISIATNGYLLTEGLSLRLIDAGVKLFTISLDAIGAVFDRMRGFNGAYKKVNFICRRLSQIRKYKKIEILISATLTKETLETILDVVEFAQGLDIPVFFALVDFTPYFFLTAKNNALWISSEKEKLLDEIINELIKIKRKKDSLIRQSYTSLHYIKNYFRDPIQKGIPCSKSLTRICIDYQGRIYGGCWSLGYWGE
ncbi:MAG: radical SAM protein, partial [Candidatus Omnitrophica bacterium]|nr:radical SAM protein [Candidatus Omnitrophota bacterium]